MQKNYLTTFVSLVLVLVSANAFSQFSNSRFFIRFTDKNNSPYSISNPSAYLSTQAILRRTNQGININQQDLPVNPQYIDSVRAHGGTIYNRSKWLNGVTISAPSQAILNNILALPFVVSSTHVKRPISGAVKKNEIENGIGLSRHNEPNENQIASLILSWMPICIAATFKVPRGNEPRKLMNIPQKKILIIFITGQR